ncbi:antibiotic biosynthesis monooxygenase family protein [Arthrobacter sp. 9V]|uniref:antibiotic biosynthesis monooxygenase family protein n=1 Tax=Arthrobacter sp. 9V TaxID=2653132 RepID=UPI001357B17C|nr:antibiotic biosynthesis monooxygenase [Arthrobacter sp. 9V]
MMTVVSTMQLQSSSESEWDQLIRERFRSAHDREGWMSGQLLSPADAPNVRVIVGTWRNQRDWEAWHEDPAFLSTRARLDELQQVDHQTVWYNVIEEAQANDD